MKAIKVIVIVLFLAIILTPLFLFNFREDYVSEADNRVLANNPFRDAKLTDPSLGSDVKSYISDRIGLRAAAMSAYNLINDRFFGIMDHPYYMKGKDGYIFMRKFGNVTYTDYHRRFAQMIVQIDAYCKERGVPFLFVFEPEKLSVMRELAPAGMQYDDSWVDEFLAVLDENGVRYVDNTRILTEKYHGGEAVFNKQYDAGHWNDIGAFYGVNYILEGMRADIPDIHINTTDEFTYSTEDNVDLQQIGVLVEETTPLYTPKVKPEKKNAAFPDELCLNKDHHYFNYFVNENVESPRVLFFQGSYMNTRGYKFMANALGEYIAVHDYENVFDFDYYFDIFEPEYVVFEVAEYTFTDMFFKTDSLYAFTLPPAYDSFADYDSEELGADEITVTVSKGESVADLTVTGVLSQADYAYAEMNGRVYDLRGADGEYRFSVSADRLNTDDLHIVAVDTDGKIRYHYR